MSEDNTNNEQQSNNQYELERVRWEGVLSSPIGKTPFGFFDQDATFIDFAPGSRGVLKQHFSLRALDYM